MKILRHMFLFLSLLLLSSQPILAQDDTEETEITYVRASTTGTTPLKGCILFEGVKRVLVQESGTILALPASLGRDIYSLPRKYRYFACAQNEEGSYIVYAKTGVNATAVEFELTTEDFPENESDLSACNSIVDFPSDHIYKTIGSTHFSTGDVRRNTIGLILENGASGPFPSCVDVLDTEGNEVASLGLYERGRGYAARYYAGIGCGSSTPYNGSSVAGRAKQNTGSKEIYFDFGSVCYGPIDASRCQGSSQC